MRSRGFSLVEVIIAIVILTIGLLSLAQLMAVATRTNQLSGRQTSAAALAKAQMERLKGIPFYAVTEVEDDEDDEGGPPPITKDLRLGGDIDSNAPGYHQFYDPDGRVVAASGALYVVRWQIDDIAAPRVVPPIDVLLEAPQPPLRMKRITVRCLPASEEGNQFRRIGDAVIVSYRTANIGW